MRIKASAWIVAGAGLATLVLIGLLTVWPELPMIIEHAGVNVPSQNVYLDYIEGVAWACLLATTILFWPVSMADRVMLLEMWAIRCVVMLVIMLPYEAHYSSLDCWVYFAEAHSAGANWFSMLLKGGSNFVIALGALHLTIAPDSYHAMKVSSGYVGMAAIYLFYRAGVVLIGAEKRWTFWALGLYPSVLFWSSILGKDPIVLLGIALHVWGLVRVVYYGQHKHLVAVIGGIVLASVVRVWMGPILLVPALVLFALKIRHLAWRMLTVSVVIGLLVILARATVDRLDIDPETDLFSSTQSFTKGWDKANSALHPDVELNSLSDLILFTPQSVFTAYFRPLPEDSDNVFSLIAGFEDLLLLFLSCFALFKFKWRYLRNHFFLWALAVLMTWGLAYSLVTYKDLGSAVRFRLQIMPVLLGIVCFLISQPRYESRAR